jgi:hypothetical protein
MLSSQHICNLQVKPFVDYDASDWFFAILWPTSYHFGFCVAFLFTSSLSSFSKRHNESAGCHFHNFYYTLVIKFWFIVIEGEGLLFLPLVFGFAKGTKILSTSPVG